MTLEHLLSTWQKVAQQLESARRILLLTDYDGTLTPIVERPELANLPGEVKQLLQSLSHQHRFTIGIISGRALLDLKNRVDIAGITYAGNHGLEVEGPGLSFVNPLASEVKPLLRIMHQILRRGLGTIRGVLVENKGLTLSVHYRQVDETKAGDLKSELDRVLIGPQATGAVRVTQGKKVYEIRPAVDWDKGKAIKLLMRKYGKGGRESGLLPIYMGDDLTDEEGFRTIERYGNGISVFIGDTGASSARYFLKSPAEVTEFLRMLLKAERSSK